MPSSQAQTGKARSHLQWSHSNEEECRRAGGVLEVVGRRWSPGILLALGRGAERFTDIMAAAPGISARMLTLRLKDLEAADIVERRVIPTMPVSVHYGLTPRGTDLVTALRPISGFVQRWNTDEAAPIPE